MAQAVTIAGASYSDVPGLLIPKTGGGTAYFADPSPVTAVESDVAQGKIFVKADGSLGTGTASGGGGGGIIIEDTADTAGGTVRTITAVEISGTKTITQNGTGIDVTEYAAVDVAVPSSAPTLETVTNIDPTESSQTIEPSTGYDGIESVQINAISSSYVGSGITRRSSSDLTASGDTVTVPAGYYASQGTKAVASGTAGTPTATKGTVSNHQVSVTPSVTNQTGYITGSTKTGTVVTVSASELVSGDLSITANGSNIDCSTYSTVTVNVPTGSSKAIYKYEGLASRQANSYGATSATVTVTKAGTYNINFVAIRGSSSGTMGTNLYIGSSGKGNNTTFNNGTYGQYVSYTSQSIAANTAVTIYATSGSNSRYIYVGQLIVEEV